MATFARECPCQAVESAHRLQSDSAVFCPVCVNVALHESLDRHKKVLQKRNEAREECAKRLTEIRRGKSLSELEYESQRLREHLASLRQQCGSLAVQVASQVVENDERRAHQENPGISRAKLNSLTESLCDPERGALMRAIVSSTGHVKVLRFRWAIQVFAMHRLDVDQEDSRPNTRHRHARGIGKIGGLPIPHAGPELYSVLPPHELQSALRLVASLISTVARCLGIVLPHPILLQPNGPVGDITDTVTEQSLEQQATRRPSPELSAAPSVASSTSSLTSLIGATSAWGRSAKKALKRATGGQQALKDVAHTMIPPSMDASVVAKRLHHATSAVLAEDNSPSSSLYALSQSQINDESFAIGLQLLQNNVVALCIRAGVPVATLWPAEAILLNLHALWCFCKEQVDQHEA